MYIGKVIGTVVCTIKHPAYEGKRLLMVQPLDTQGKPRGDVGIAIDYVGAGLGDLALVGGAPGVAADVFNLEKAPIRDLIMGIVDRWDVAGDRVLTLYEEPEGMETVLSNPAVKRGH
ncbi:MAG: EutN/CcmL family microcompartment protein [Anaerolineae bacterium]|nr:EutN/CcmL family microcompartment protein [Anaerolineae bacterium]